MKLYSSEQSSNIIRWWIRKYEMKPCECGIASPCFRRLTSYIWNLKTGEAMGKLCEALSWFHQLLLVIGPFRGGDWGSVLWNLQIWFLLPSFSWLQRMPQSHRPSFHHKMCHTRSYTWLMPWVKAGDIDDTQAWLNSWTQWILGSLWWKRVNPMSSVVPEICSDNALFSSLVETDVQMVI